MTKLAATMAARNLLRIMLLCAVASVPFLAVAQVPQNELGVHPEETYDGARENINLATGGLNVMVPLLKLPGRNGLDYSITLAINTQFWNISTGAWSTNFAYPYLVMRSNEISFGPTRLVYYNGDYNHECMGVYFLWFGDGSIYTFPNLRTSCQVWVGPQGTGHWQADPTSDIRNDYDTRGEGFHADLTACKLTLKDGTFYPLSGCSGNPPGNGASTGVIEDPNGNQITMTPGNPITDTDTLGRTITIAGSGNGPIQYKDSNGVLRTITINYTSVPISCYLPFPAGWQGHLGGTLGMPSSVVLPDGLTYTFQYDGCGDLNKITYPSGGYTRYDYDTQDYTQYASYPYNGNTDSTAASYIEVVAKHVCRAPSMTLGATSTGSGNTCTVSEDTTTYTPNANGNNLIGNYPMTNNSQNIVVDPLGNQTIYQFTNSGPANNPPVESSRAIYQGTSTLLRTIQTTATPASANLPAVQTTILANGLQSQIQWDYYLGCNGNSPCSMGVKEKREYPYGQGAPGSLVRKTDYQVGICDRTTSEIVYDGSNNQLSQTTYELDNYTAGIGASGAVQHDPTYNTSYTARCNVTAVSRWRNSDGATLTTRNQYDDAGNVLSTADPLTHTTTTSYADVWGNTTCKPSSGNAAAFPTQVTDAAGLITKSSYNSCSGTVATTTDPNKQVTSFSYDLMGRTITAAFPDGGQSKVCYSEVSGGSCYSSSYPLELVATQAITSTLNKVSTTVLDGLARTTEAQLNSDPDCTASGGTKVDTTYDGAEHTSTVSNPYCTTSDTTYGITTYQYDALSRVVKMIPPDGTGTLNNVSTTNDIVSSTNPPGNCSIVTDETGKARKSCSDALGRMTQAFEDPNGLNYETDYQYDMLDNLIRVDQKGSAPSDSTQWRTRTFAYNSLSQLLCAANPEIAIVTCPNPDNGSYTAGTVRYAYDNDGNLITKTSPKPNQGSSSVTVQTTYGYDLDNRLTTKSYNDGSTAPVQFAYDGGTLSNCTTKPPGDTDSYPSGRRTAMCDGSGAASWTHDKMGRVLQERRTIGTVVGQYDTDAYNLDGSAASITSHNYSVAYTYSGAGRPITATSSSTSPATKFVGGAHYAPPGELTGMTMGAATGFAGITVANAYSNRLQPVLLSATSPSGTVFGDCFDFHLGLNAPAPCSFSASSLGNNGNVNQIVNNRDNTRTQNFIYDSLNRIQQAYSSGPSWGETFGPTATNPGVAPATPGIDAWANLTNREGVTGKTHYEPLSESAGTNNQLSGFAYDAAGNMTNNGSYVYDAENRLIATAGYSYIYDGDGQRVEKCTEGTPPGTCASGATGTLYWRGTASAPLTETNLSGAVQNTYVFFNGQRIARSDSAGLIHYYFSDHLGSHTVVENATGSACEQDIDYYPYGGQENDYCTTPVAQHYKFNGKERDSESGLDDFPARYYTSAMGRWMTPDPMGGHVEDPQTLNRYAYARNNPTSLTDPTGLDFYLSCQHTDNNGSTCQQMQVGTDKNGNAQMAWVQGATGDNGFTATQIGNDANGNLVDRTTGTGAYSADVTGSGVQLSNNGGATSATGVFLNKDVDLSGTNQVQSYDTVVRAGNLPGFLFTFQNSKLEASQTSAGFFTYGGTALEADRALEGAGFNYTMFGGVHYGSNEYRSPGDPSGHFIVNPTIQEPIAGVPQTRGTMHFGETNPSSDFWKHVSQWWQ